jgi:hypothetical protein
MKIKCVIVSDKEREIIYINDVYYNTTFKEFQELISEQVFNGEEVDHFPIKNERLWLWWISVRDKPYEPPKIRNMAIMKVMGSFGFGPGGFENLDSVLITGYQKNLGPGKMEGTYCRSVAEEDIDTIMNAVQKI